MRILLTGGTGVLGREVVEIAASAGHAVRVGSRSHCPIGFATGREWVLMDLASGSGIKEAVADVNVVIHAASDPRNSQIVDVEGTRALLQACRASGVRHFIYVSIVGIDRISMRYYRHKLETEEIVSTSGVSYSILRATQFHPFLDRLIGAVARIPLLMPVPAGFQVQSVAPSEVARRLLRCVASGPGGRVPDFGGPETMTLVEAVRQWQKVRGVKKQVIGLPLPGRIAAAVRDGASTVAVGEHGTVRWLDWLVADQATPPSVAA